MIVVGIIALLLGGTLISGLLSGRKRRKSCVYTAEATCKQIMRLSRPNNSHIYEVKFEYEYKNRRYNSIAIDIYYSISDLKKLGIEEGKPHFIFLNPQDPKQIYARKKKVYVGDIVVWCFAIEFTVLGLYLIIDIAVKWLMKFF